MGAAAPLVTVDGARQTPVVGTDRGHSVSRVVVPILPGQQRVVRAVVVEPVDIAGLDAAPQVLAQPMAPATTSLGEAPACS